MRTRDTCSAGGRTRFMAAMHSSAVASPLSETSSNSASPGMPEDSAEAKDITICGLKPLEYAIGSPLLRSARCMVRCKSSRPR